MRVTILGSGTLIPHAERSSAGHLLEGDDLKLLLDCGSGTLHGLARWVGEWHALTHVVITHFHADHVGDLAPLLFAYRNGRPPGIATPLTVMGPPGLADFLDRLTKAFGAFVSDPGVPLNVVEIADDEARSLGGGWTLRTHLTHHTDDSRAYRVTGPGGTMAYSGDTGPMDGLGDFLGAADVAICECGHPDPPPVDTHLSPMGIVDLFGDETPGVLVTTHCYPTLDAESVPDLLHELGYPGRVVAGADGLTLDVGADGVEVAPPGP